MSLPTYHLEYGRHLVRLHRHHAYAPASNTASQKTMRKSTHGFPFASYIGMGLPGCQSSAITIRKDKDSQEN